MPGAMHLLLIQLLYAYAQLAAEPYFDLLPLIQWICSQEKKGGFFSGREGPSGKTALFFTWAVGGGQFSF